jgi:hypothetical protein
MIWLTQWKCPSDHTALALAWDETADDHDAIVEQGEGYFARGILNRWCGICGRFGISGAPIVLHIEHGRTTFRTIEEAKPVLLTVQAQNLRSKAWIKEHRN